MSTQTAQIENDAMDSNVRKYAFGRHPNAGINDSRLDDTMRAIADGRRASAALTYHDGRIYEGMPVTVGDKTVLPRDAVLVKNVDLFHQHRILGASGKVDEAAKIKASDIFSDRYLAIRERAKAEFDMVSANPYVPVHQVLAAKIAGAAGAITTDYETVRRVNYLMQVTGPSYMLEKYNAINAVNVLPTENLNVKGFRRTAKLSGNKELGDKQRPSTAPNTYASFEKWILADGFRYETSLRERSDSVFGLEAQFTQDIPGIFAELKDDKITSLATAVSDTTPTTDWDALLATYETHYTSHAEDDVGAADEALEDYGGMTHLLWPRATRNAYMRNIGGKVTTDKDSLALATQGSRGNPRIESLPMNPGITAIVNASITAASFVGVNKDQWAALLQGPRIQVTYSDPMTPGQLEGRIIFDYNGVVERTPSAAVHYVGLLS